MTARRPLQIVVTFKTLLLAVALFLLTWAVISIRDTLLIVVVGVFLGLVFEGPVRFVQRKTRLGRGMSATVTVIGALVVVALLALVLLKPFLKAMQSFLKDLPQTVEQLRNSDELGFLGDTSAANTVQSGAQSVSNAVPDALGALVGFAGSVASAGLAVFLITFICLFFLCEVDDLKASLASVLPKTKEDLWLPLWDRVTTMVSRWAIGVVIIATIAGTTQGLTAYLLGSSSALALGLIAGFLDMIPNIGATIAGFILTFVLLAQEGLTAALIMLAVVLVYQQIENSILTPTIQGKAVKLSAFFIIVSVALFGALLGVVGALIAVPVAATIQIILGEVTKTYRAQVGLSKQVPATVAVRNETVAVRNETTV
jgi:predicted PurR-regulated permease PerM